MKDIIKDKKNNTKRKKEDEKIKEIEREKNNEEEKESDKKKWLLLLLLFLFMLFTITGLTYIFNEDFRDKVDEMLIKIFSIDTPNAPKITADSKTWGKKQVVKVEKDAKSNSGIAYYEYCIVEENNFDNCNWEITTTKNMVAATTGKYFVAFRGVSNNGKSGKKSNVEEIWVDNESPNITSLRIENKEEGKAEVSVIAKDSESGIGKYYYKLKGNLSTF